jgi:hypothetical protein
MTDTWGDDFEAWCASLPDCVACGGKGERMSYDRHDGFPEGVDCCSTCSGSGKKEAFYSDYMDERKAAEAMTTTKTTYEIRCSDMSFSHGEPAEAAVHVIADTCDQTCEHSPHVIMKVETTVVPREQPVQ